MKPDTTSSRSSRPTAPASKASAASRSAASAGRCTAIRWNPRALATGVVLLALCGTLSGCYYAHLAAGQARLLLARRSLAATIEDPATPETIRERLELVRDVRGFAEGLGLAVDGQYTSYVEWPGDRIVTTVVATGPGRIEPHEFDFPIVGRVPYKGFFARERAEREAMRLRDRGFDVCLLPIPAYSTLGWWNDPVTTPMLRTEPERVVETVLHELVHATVFVESQPDFNEGLATFLGQEAAIRFQGDAARERERVARDRALAAFLNGFRDRVADLYASEPAGPERVRLREALETSARDELAAAPFGTREGVSLADLIDWNDACLALRGPYHADLPLHTARLDALGGDLGAFLEAARRASEADDPRSAFFGPP